MSNFNKSDVANALADRMSITKQMAAAMIDEFLHIVKTETDTGKTVNLTGFGRFSVKDRPERPGRNPATGETITIPASRILAFKASKSST